VIVAIAYPLTAYILMEQIFIMPEVKVNAKKQCFKGLSRGCARLVILLTRTRNSGDTILNLSRSARRQDKIKYGVPGFRDLCSHILSCHFEEALATEKSYKISHVRSK